MTYKPKLAILLEFGFHEIKKYIHSGFAKELSTDFDIVWFAMDKGSKEFHDYFTSTGFPLVYFDEKDFKKPPSKIEQYNQIIRRNWIANKNLGGFHNHSKVRTKSFKTAVLGNSLAKLIIEKLAVNRIKRDYISPTIKTQLVEHSIDTLFLTGYNSNFSRSFVASGISLDKKVHFLANSWKDLFINNFVPFKSLSTLFVWSEQMIKDFKFHMPYLKQANFVISGNPTFDILIDAQTNNDRKFYAEKYGVSESAKWLLYTMMPVGLVMDEIDNIQFIANELGKKYSKEECSIIIRKNPTHDASDFGKLKLPENLVLAEHFCTYDKEKDMIVQSESGEKEWIDLLQHSSLNISVPSTVTLEFLALNKPVFNVEFNSKNNLDPRVKQFFEAGFYKPLFENGKAKRCQNITSLLNEIDNASSSTSSTPKSQIKASSIITKTLKKSLLSS